MNLYKLDDKAMDATFLKGEPVFCRAVVPSKEQKQKRIKEGESIVVMLSSGAKYKGRIKRFNAIRIGDYDVGEMEIIKV